MQPVICAKNCWKKNYNVDFDIYYNILLEQEFKLKYCESYDFSMVAAYHTVFSHVTYYYKLSDLFQDHRQFVIDFIGKYGFCYYGLYISNEYDTTFFNILNGCDGTDDGDEFSRNLFIDDACALFQKEFVENIIPDIKVLASIIMFEQYKLRVITSNKENINQNKLKTQCLDINHNAVFSQVNFFLDKKVNYQRFIGNNNNEFYALTDFDLILSAFKVIRQKIFESQKIITLELLCLKKLDNIRHYAMANYNDNKFLQLPVKGSYVNKFYNCLCGVSLDYDNQNGSLFFNYGFKYVIYATNSPVFWLIDEQKRKYFQGAYFIMVNGLDVVIYNYGLATSVIYEHDYEIRMNDSNMLIWVNSIVPAWEPDVGFNKNYKFLVFNENVSGFNAKISQIAGVLQQLQFTADETSSMLRVSSNFEQNGF